MDWQAFLCIHEGLFYFRINSLGAWILGFSSEFVPPIEEAQPVLRVPPNTVADLFREARSRVGRIVIRNSARIYGCECPALAKLVTNDSRLHGLCHLAENRLAVVPSDSVQRFREALGRLGYAAPSVSANPSPG